MSDERDRYGRDDPARGAPIRDWWSAPPSSYSTQSSDPQGASPPPREEGDGSFGRVITEVVDLGYQVIEEQIRLGQRVAEGIGRRRYGPVAMTNDFRETAERVLDIYGQAGQLWLELFSSMWSGGVSMPWASAGRSEPATPGATPAPEVGASIGLQLACSRPVRAILELRPGCEGRSLATPELRALDREKPPLSDVGFDQGGDRPLLLRIHVPDTQPAGSYHGVVVDRDSGRQCGTLVVQVAE